MKTNYETGTSQMRDEYREILNAQLDKVKSVRGVPKKRRGTYRDYIFQIGGYDFVLYDGADDNFFQRDGAGFYKSSINLRDGYGSNTWTLANLDAPYPYPNDTVTGRNVFAVSGSTGFVRLVDYYSNLPTCTADNSSLFLFLKDAERELQEVRTRLLTDDATA